MFLNYEIDDSFNNNNKNPISNFNYLNFKDKKILYNILIGIKLKNQINIIFGVTPFQLFKSEHPKLEWIILNNKNNEKDRKNNIKNFKNNYKEEGNYKAKTNNQQNKWKCIIFSHTKKN